MRKNINPLLMVSLVFLTVGLFFLVMGIVFAFNIEYLRENGKGNVDFIPVIFIGFGAVFSIVSFSCIILVLRKKKLSRKLIEDGNYVMAEYIETVYNRNLRVNGRSPYYVKCHYFDSYSGLDHVFKSESVFNKPEIPAGSFIRVYVQEKNLDRYYVDISPYATDIDSII